jgi:hypothetical protein
MSSRVVVADVDVDVDVDVAQGVLDLDQCDPDGGAVQDADVPEGDRDGFVNTNDLDDVPEATEAGGVGGLGLAEGAVPATGSEQSYRCESRAREDMRAPPCLESLCVSWTGSQRALGKQPVTLKRRVPS